MKKRVAFVRLRYLPPSETFIYEELKNIKNYQPIVYTRKMMNLRRFPYRHIRYLPKNLKKIRERWKRDKIKLIHARFGNAGVKVLKAKKRANLPMIVSFHGFDLPIGNRNKQSYQRKLPALFRTGETFTVPSKQMKRLLIRKGCPAHKIIVQYSGIDLNKFDYVKRKSKKKKIRILAVGRLHEKKGFNYLIKAFKKVHKKHPDTKLIIVGSGEERGKLQRLIRKLKLQKHVKLKGDLVHQKVAKEMKRADIFCLPSVTTKDGNHEGIPNAIKEAMASGLPVVATRHGGIPELITHEKEGYLVPERNVKKLAKKIRNLIEKPNKRAKMGKKGRQKIKHRFDSKQQVRRLESIYDQTLGRRGQK